MRSIADCEKHLLNSGLSQDKIKSIRDYIYSLSKEIIKDNLEKYEQTQTKKDIK